MAAATYSLTASLQPEDMIDGSLAFAGPDSQENVAGTINPATGSAYVRATTGSMQFVAFDFGAAAVGVQTEQLFLDSAIHEVGHALGFGTLFSENGLASTVAGDNDIYTGMTAVSAFNTEYDTSVSSILLDSDGGHWNECWIEGVTSPPCDATGINDAELMTPFAVDFQAQLSPATIAAFRDLGYLTIDPFSGTELPDLPAISAVPLPAGGILLLSAFGTMFLRRKRKA